MGEQGRQPGHGGPRAAAATHAVSCPRASAQDRLGLKALQSTWSFSSPAKRAAIFSTGLRGESRSQKTRCCSRHFPGPRDIQVLGCDSAPAAGPAGSGGAHFSIWFCALHWTAPHATSPSLQHAPRPASAGLALVWVAPAPPRCSLPVPGLSPTVAPGSRDGLGRAPSSVGVGAVHELPPRVRGARARRVPGAVSF